MYSGFKFRRGRKMQITKLDNDLGYVVSTESVYIYFDKVDQEFKTFISLTNKGASSAILFTGKMEQFKKLWEEIK